ncbi:MAG TPA: hypothetical protein DCM08_08050 [Microscillaceae bacterium]|nr:hypothetical protein [Microscillaceae bacterium]
MRFLFSISSGSLITSAVLASTAAGQEAQYFQQMNMGWSAVNLAVAGFSLHRARRSQIKPSYEPYDLIKQQQDFEKAYLVNAALDVAYVVGGFYLSALPGPQSSDGAMLRGFGQSVIMQGGMLLLFDTVMYFIHRSNRRKIEPTFRKLDLSFNGMGIRLRF